MPTYRWDLSGKKLNESPEQSRVPPRAKSLLFQAFRGPLGSASAFSASAQIQLSLIFGVLVVIAMFCADDLYRSPPRDRWHFATVQRASWSALNRPHFFRASVTTPGLSGPAD